MARQSEYKKKFDPELGKFTLQHVYNEGGIEGGGIKDVFKSIGSKLFGQTVKSAVKKEAKKAVTSAATKTGEYAGKKAGDKIVKLLSREVAPRKIASPPAGGFRGDAVPPSQQEIDQMLNNLLSGGSTRKIKGNLRFP